jgi:hypothetical protein
LGGRARAPLVRRQELRPLAQTHGSGCTAWSGDGNVEALRALLVAKRSARSIRIKTTGQLRHLVITAPDDVRAQLGGLTTKALINKAAALRPSAGTDARYVRRWTRRSLSRTAQPAPTCSTGRRGDEDGGRVVTALKCLRGVCKRANDIRRATHELAARLDANQHVTTSDGPRLYGESFEFPENPTLQRELFGQPLATKSASVISSTENPDGAPVSGPAATLISSGVVVLETSAKLGLSSSARPARNGHMAGSHNSTRGVGETVDVYIDRTGADVRTYRSSCNNRSRGTGQRLFDDHIVGQASAGVHRWGRMLPCG